MHTVRTLSTTGLICCLLIMSVNADTAVKMYTDLIQMIGKNGSCRTQETYNLTDRSTTLKKEAHSQHSLQMSQLSFKEMFVVQSGSHVCDQVDLAEHALVQYNWTCFRTGNGSDLSADANWIFVDCVRLRILGVSCMNKDDISEMLDLVCKGDVIDRDCQAFNSNGRRTAVCSGNFRFEMVFYTVETNEVSFTSPLDIAAYLCIIFIVITFLLAACIPDEKCKPKYSYDNEVGLRVPLEIYEMYGVNYQPSAKKQLTKNMNIETAVEPSKTITEHAPNVAVVQSCFYYNGLSINGKEVVNKAFINDDADRIRTQRVSFENDNESLNDNAITVEKLNN